MKVLIIGGGGREHALAWKAAASARVKKVFVAPGNPGTAAENKVENIDISIDELDKLVDFARSTGIDLTIVGPEGPLVAGVVDTFRHAGLRILGPSRDAARLEGSKGYAKAFLERHAVPTARYQVFTDLAAAADYIETTALPVVIKADGLAAGKGVVVAQTRREALTAVYNMLSGNAFGDAGATVVIEDFLTGEEASFICLVDGRNVLPLASSQDHKARDDGGLGPNTGGMGAYSPAPVVTPDVHAHILQDIIEPTVAGMAAEGHPFVGFLYAGLMIDELGQARVIEFNVRLGDPETQPLLLRLDSDLITLCDATVDGRLDTVQAHWKRDWAVGVVMAAGGYPGDYGRGDVIKGVEEAEHRGCKVFHAGTSRQRSSLLTDGGRVLCVTALGATAAAAQQKAYEGVRCIHWNNAFYRHDIACRAIARLA